MLSICALDIAPCLRIQGISLERSRTVDTCLFWDGSSYLIIVMLLPKTLATSEAVVAGGEPDMLALVPVIGDWSSVATALGNQAFGTRNAIVCFPPETDAGILSALGKTSVRAPGQNFDARSHAESGTLEA